MRITKKGQITIPAEIREKAGLSPDTEVDVVMDGNEVKIVKKPAYKDQTQGEKAQELREKSPDSRGKDIVAHFKKWSKRLKDRGDIPSADEVMLMMRGRKVNEVGDDIKPNIPPRPPRPKHRQGKPLSREEIDAWIKTWPWD